MNRFIPAVLIALGAPAPLAAETTQNTAENAQSGAQYLLAELNGMLRTAFAMDYNTRKDEAHRLLLSMAGKAREGLARYGADDEARLDFQEELGLALFYTAQYHDHEPEEDAKRAQEIEWMTGVIANLEPVITAPGRESPPLYEYRGAAGQLFDHGTWLDDPRLKEWSAANVRANRAMLASYAEHEDNSSNIVFEKNMLAQALYRNGFLTGNNAEIAEANALLASMDDEQIDYSTMEMRKAVEEKRAPYPAPRAYFFW